LDYDKLVDELSVEIIQRAAQNYLNTNNYVKVVLYPEVVE
jgi:predicted Zn-dependent peptidase